MNKVNDMNYKAKEINLKETFSIIKKRAWIILLLTTISTIIGYVYNFSSTSYLYSASARVIIEADEGLMKTFQVVIKDTAVLGKVVEDLGLSMSAESLANQITVQTIDDSSVVSINVVDVDPTNAANIANTTVKVVMEEAPSILDFKALKVLSAAKVNPKPINEKSNKPVIFAFIVGIAVGIGFVFILDSFDDSFRSNREIEGFLDLPVLGRISKINNKNLKKKPEHQGAVLSRGEIYVSKT